MHCRETWDNRATYRASRSAAGLTAMALTSRSHHVSRSMHRQQCCMRSPTVSSRHSSRASSRRLPIVAVTNLTEAEWEQEVLKSDVPVLVDFWAPWCGPCRLVAPLMDWAEKEHKGALKVVKVEHDGNKALVEKYKVYGLPTLMVFKDGQEVPGSKQEGAVGKAVLVDYIKKHALTTVSA